jgi:hypothetical protein
MVLKWFLFGEKNVSAFLPNRNEAWKSGAIGKGMNHFQIALGYVEKGGG